MRPGTPTALIGILLATGLAVWYALWDTPPKVSAKRAWPDDAQPRRVTEPRPTPAPALPTPIPGPAPAPESDVEEPAPGRPELAPPPSDPDEALQYYTDALKASKTYSKEWWDAKYWSLVSRYRKHLRLTVKGRTWEAEHELEGLRQLLENMRLVTPTLGGAESAKRFRDLAASVGLVTGWEEPDHDR